MFRKKWIVNSGIITSILLLGACAESDLEHEDETSQTELNQTESKDTNKNTPTNENSDEKNKNTSEDTDEDIKSNGDTEETREIDQESLKADVKNPSSLAVLANKEYSLPEDYAPGNLETVDVPTVLPNPEIKQMRRVAAEALKNMFDAAKKEEIILYARSGYRSYDTQVQLFKNYAANHGEEAANKYSAKPGESEHQTGLVMDVTSESVNLQITSDFGETKEGQWVKGNAHNYGFIIRYPEGKSDITGYVYEPWHLRFLGEELATEVFESDLTYEEYLVEKGVDIEIQ